ncbi:MAG: TetR/AcrR family transcriptional regulator [Acidobacteriota bacterium]
MARSRWISDLHWVREGKQSRSQKTQNALLDAAEELFSEQGVEATSVADVAARAGFSVGAVYHHFRDKKALLYGLFDRMTELFHETAKQAADPQRWEGARIPDILRGYLEFYLELVRERPGFKQAALEATRNDPELLAHMNALKTEMNEDLTALLLARKSEIDHPDPETAVAFVLDQFAAMLNQRKESRLEPSLLAERSDEEFVREALRSSCAYLQVDPAETE